MKLSPITDRVQVGDLFWKRPVDQFRGLAGPAVSDVNLPPPDIVRQSGLFLIFFPPEKSEWQMIGIMDNLRSGVQLTPQPRKLTHCQLTQFNNHRK